MEWVGDPTQELRGKEAQRLGFDRKRSREKSSIHCISSPPTGAGGLASSLDIPREKNCRTLRCKLLYRTLRDHPENFL